MSESTVAAVLLAIPGLLWMIIADNAWRDARGSRPERTPVRLALVTALTASHFCLAAVIDTIEIGSVYDPPLDPDTLALLRTHDVTYVPSLAQVEAFLRRVEGSDPPDNFPADAWRSLRQRQQNEGIAKLLSPFFEGVRAAGRAGVRIGAGTAGGTAFGASLHRELALLVQAGLSPPEALLSATRHAAHALRQEREHGTVEPGKMANLVLVAGRPWVRIEDVGAVRLVIERGRVVVGAS